VASKHKKYVKCPAVTGKQLIKLFKHIGTIKGKVNHGLAMHLIVNGKQVITIIPDKSDSIPESTLGLILGPNQTTLGKKGLLSLINKYGL